MLNSWRMRMPCRSKVLGFEDVVQKRLAYADGQEPHKELVKRLDVPNDAITSESPSNVLSGLQVLGLPVHVRVSVV